MYQSFSVIFWMKRGKADKLGKAPIYARVTIKGKRAEISTGQKVESERWNVNTGNVKGNKEEARIVNAALENIRNKIKSTYYELSERQIERLRMVRDVFVFCCYTGLAYADVYKLKPSDISRGIDGEYWLFAERKKTGVSSNVPLLPPALAILEKYRSYAEVTNGEKLLPVITNQRLNAYLKEIADVCGIQKNLTFHIARHTFATTVTLTNGVPMESVSSMLGHKNLRTTQVYAKVVEKKVSEDMKMLKSKLMANNRSDNQEKMSS